MSKESTPVFRHIVLTSLFCLVSSNQSALAAPERLGFAQKDGSKRNPLHHQRHQRNHFNDALQKHIAANQLARPEASGRADRFNHAQLVRTRSDRHNQVSPFAKLDLQINASITENRSFTNKIDLDLTSSTSSIVLGKKLFGGADSVAIKVGDSEKTFVPGSQVTAGQYVAIRQVLENGAQELVLNGQGTAAGGSFKLDSVVTPRVNDLVIPTGVSGVETFNKNAQIGVRGDLTNFGSIVAVSTNKNLRSGVLYGKSINNEDGASISTSLPDSLSNPGTTYDFELTLAADDRIKNAGTISNAGNITLSVGNGSLSNSGAITSGVGDINVTSAGDININAEGGKFQALNGNINVRDAAYSGAGNIDIRGGDYLSQNLNLYSGNGIIHGIVGNVTGKLNTTASIEHFYASSETLRIGDNCVTGDPTFANTAGGIQIQGVNTFGEAVAFLANGDITADNTAQIDTNGFNVYMVAGAVVSVSAGPETSTVPGTEIGAGTTATVDFASGNGGNVDLTGSSVGTIIDTSSATGNGGNVVLAAFANGTTGGSVLLAPASTIDTHSTFADGSGGNVTVLAGASPATATTTVQIGGINSGAGPGTGSAGSIEIQAAQPTGTAGTAVTFNDVGQIISGGPIVAGAPSTNGQVTVGSVLAISSNGTGDLTIATASDITLGATIVSNNVSLTGSSVTATSIAAGGDIIINTSVLHNNGAIQSSKVDGNITVHSTGALSLDGAGSFSLTGGGAGQILLDASLNQALALTASHTFNPGAGGSVYFRSEDEGGSITVAPGITLTFDGGGDVIFGTSLLDLGNGSTINATMASEIQITSGGSPNSLTIVVPDNGSASIVTNGGTIALVPTTGMDLIFTNLFDTGTAQLDLLGGAVSTTTSNAATVVEENVHLNSDNALAMSASGTGIQGLGFQPYVGSFVNGNQTVQFNGYTLDTVKQLLQQLKTDGYTDVATYSQGSFYFNGQFFGPTDQNAGSNKFIIQAANQIGMTVSAGVFQQGVSGDGFNVADTLQEVSYILDQAQKFPGTVKEIIICNESIFGPNSLNQLISVINQAITMRNNTSVSVGSGTKFDASSLPITTRQRWDVLAGVDNGANPIQGALKTLINTVEGHIYGNMYAYFDGSLPTSFSTAPQDQGTFTTAVTNSMNGTLTAFRTAFTNQGLTTQIRIGETGWPTDGLRAPPLSTAPALANVTLAKWYLQAMKTWSATNNVSTVYFQGYDQPWQTVPAAQVPTTPGSSEGYFGLYTANGTSTLTLFTLTGITNKFGPTAALASGLRNAGAITADDVTIGTNHLMNSGSIASMTAAGGVAISSSNDLKVSGTGSITRTGGGTGDISFTTTGANEVSVTGSQTLDAGSGNTVSFNADDTGGSVKIDQGAVVDLPTDNTAFEFNTEHLVQNGTIDTHSGTNPGTTIVFNGDSSSTIADHFGDLDLSGYTVNVTNGGNLALLAAGNIVNTGAPVDINLSSGTGKGGDLLMVSGFSFKTITIGTNNPIHILDATSTTSGSVNLTSVGHEVNIDTSGATDAGKVEIYANGAISLNNVTAQGGTGSGGEVIVRGPGITVGNIDTTSAAPSMSGSVELSSGVIVHDGVNVISGDFDSGNFDIPTLSGIISVGDVNTGQGTAILRTDGPTGTITFNAALPNAHALSILAGTGIVNLPGSTISVVQDTVGNGGSIEFSAATVNGAPAPLVLNAFGTGAGNGGFVSYTDTNTAENVIDSTDLQIHAAGTNGGTAIISTGGSMTIDPVGVIDVAQTGPNGSGANIGLIAGLLGPGNLIVNGDLIADGSGTGAAGSITLGSNSSDTLIVSSPKAKNGVRGLIAIGGVTPGATPGSLSVSNSGGGVSVMQTFPSGLLNLTLNTAGATKGDIRFKDVLTATNSINITAGGKGMIPSGLMTAPTINLVTGSKSISAKVNTANLVASSGGSVKVKNSAAGAVTLGASTAGNGYSYSGNGAITTSGDITASSKLVIETTAGDIVVGGNLIANEPKKGSIRLKTTDTGNILNSTPAGTNSAQAASVLLQSTSGSIGAGTAIGTAFRVSTANLRTETTGLTNVNNLGTVDLTLSRVNSTDSFSLFSQGSVLISSRMSSPTNILIDTTSGAGSISASKMLGDSSTTQSVSLATNTGNISATKGIDAAALIGLLSLSGGNIGTTTDAIQVSAPDLSANTNGAGIVNLDSSLDASVTLQDSSSGGNFTLRVADGLTINDIDVSNGALFVSTETGQLSTVPGASITAASTGAAGSGSITLQAIDPLNSSILIGNATNIGTSGTGGGDVSIFVGANPPPAANPLPPGATGNYFVTTSGGGQVFVDQPTVTANLPANNLNAIGKNIFIGGSATNPVVLDGAVTITADPPITVVFSSEGPVQTALDLETTSNSSDVSPVVGGGTRHLGSSQTTITNFNVMDNAVLADGQSVYSSSQPPVHPASVQKSAVTQMDLLSSYKSAEAPEETLFLGTASKPKTYEIDAEVIGENYAATSNDVPTKSVKTGFKAKSNPESNGVVFNSGNALIAPKFKTTVATPFGSISIAANSMVLLMVRDDSMSIFNLHDERKSSVLINSGGKAVALHPGSHATVTRSGAKEFHLVNPAEIFEYRRMNRTVWVDNAHLFTSEFSVPIALVAVKPVRHLLSSNDKEKKRLAQQVLKTTAILAELNSSTEPFRAMLHPRVAVAACQK